MKLAAAMSPRRLRADDYNTAVRGISKFRSPGRLLRQMNMTLYLPDEGRFVLKYLEGDSPERMIRELEILSSLGSSWASAALACIYLAPGPEGQRNAPRALQLTQGHAQRGDTYATFAYAWALHHSGQPRAAIQAMLRAASCEFPPAVLDLVTFIWQGWGIEEKSPETALRWLRQAFRLNHAMAPWWLFKLYRSGKFGFMRRVLGYLIAPVGLLWFVIAARIDPFSCRVFTLSTSAGPVFRGQLDGAPTN